MLESNLHTSFNHIVVVFSQPVISVFSVPDSVGLLCVTLGQLEIQEVR